MSHIVILAGSVQEAHKYTRQADLPRGRYICPMSASQIDGVVPSEVHTLPGFRKRRDVHAILATVKRSSKRYQHVKFFEIDERGPLTERQIVVAHRYNALLDAGIPENVDPVIAMASVEFTPEDLLDEQAIHFVANGAMLHAVHDVTGATGVDTPEDVTCRTCLDYLEKQGLPRKADMIADINSEANTSNGDEMVAEGAPAAEPKRRRSKCSTCGTLHFKGDPCELAPDFVIG